MQTPSFRFVAMPLAAILALTALSMQPASSKSPRDAVSVREPVVDCSRFSASEICVIEHAGS